MITELKSKYEISQKELARSIKKSTNLPSVSNPAGEIREIIAKDAKFDEMDRPNKNLK